MSGRNGIRPGQQLVTKTGRASCRLGAIAVGPDGSMIGLTARHIVESEEEASMFDAVTGAFIGRRSDRRPCLTSGDEFYETIGLIELDERLVAIDESDEPIISVEAAKPRDRIGSTVRKLEAGGFSTGRLEGYGGSIEFQYLSGSQPIILRNFLELSFPSETATAPGEAGSPIIDESGALLGLLIGGNADRAYAAPVQPFMRRHRYRLFRPNPSTANSPEEALREVEMDLRSTSHGAEQLRRDIIADDRNARDPYGERMPHKLVKLIKEVA